MKKLFTTVLMLTVALSGWSQLSVTSWDGGSGTLTIKYEGGQIKKADLDGLVGGPAEGREGKVQKLVLEGVWANADINTDDFQKFVYEKCLGNKPNQEYNGKTLYLDLEACSNLKCDKTGINDAGTKFTYEPVDGNQQVSTTYTYRKETTYTYKYWGDNVVDIPDPDNHDWVGYINPFNNDPNMTAEVHYVNGQWVILDPWGGTNDIVLNLTPSTTWYDITNGTPGEVVENINEGELTATDDPNIFTKTVTENITVSAFSLSKTKSYINGITFPAHNKFTLVPEQLFSGSTVLETVVLPNNIEAIEREAFRNCTALNDITWSTGLQYIGLDNCEEKSKGSFEGCTALTAINLANTSLKEIGRNAFTSTTGATGALTLPASLEIIGPEAFHGSGITSVDLNVCKDKLWKLNYECFEESSLQSVTFPTGNKLTYLGNDAFHKCTSLGEVDMRNCTGITEFQHSANGATTYKTFAECSSLKRVILPPNVLVIPDDSGTGVFAASKAIEYLEFTGTPIYEGCTLTNGLYIGDKAFQFCRSLKEIKFSKNVETLGANAFQDAAIEEIHIPASVEVIKYFCFDDCQQLKKVYFDAFDVEGCNCVGAATIIEGHEGEGGQGAGAFEECQSITDVYINTLAELHCDNNAFDSKISWGTGDADGNFATLHYPKEKTSHYVNLAHYLTDEIVKEPGKFHNWLMEHYNQALIPHKNGWYEFINAGPTDPNDNTVYQSIMLRTFSDWEYSYLVPNGLRAYVVTGIDPKGEDYEVTLQRIRVIPAQTGVILYGHPNGRKPDGSPTLVLTPVSFIKYGDPVYQTDANGKIVYDEDGQPIQIGTYQGESQGMPLRRDYWDHSSNYVKNYLMPIISENGTSVSIAPYERDKNTKEVVFRNFALGRYTSTDYYLKDMSTMTDLTKNYVGFFRMKPLSYRSGYAYLHLTKDEYPVADGGEILVKPDTQKNLDNEIYPYNYEFKISDGKPFDASAAFNDDGTPTDDNPKGWWNPKATDKTPKFTWDEYSLSWGTRPFGSTTGNSITKYFGEFEEDADGVVKLVIPANDNANNEYYTLQGVRVTNPTKGVYILNGKKVVIK
ncbi:MAG: leucine-rich repeat domain-containing protein [Prevotella sp.]|nr:leucine-rich repeat domain-containing protein [Prevotella sp.]